MMSSLSRRVWIATAAAVLLSGVASYVLAGESCCSEPSGCYCIKGKICEIYPKIKLWKIYSYTDSCYKYVKCTSCTTYCDEGSCRQFCDYYKGDCCTYWIDNCTKTCRHVEEEPAW